MDTTRLPFLARLLYADWDEAPEAMAFEESWRDILGDCARLASALRPGLDRALAEPASMDQGYWEEALALFVRVPALINVVLNWKICLEQGLPLHPTRYFEVNDETRDRVAYPEGLKARAHAAFVESIAVARSLVRLDPEAETRIAGLATAVEPAVLDFVFTSIRDAYTWRASDPSKLLKLASRVEEGTGPDDRARLVLGAAHGSLGPALVLSETLGCDLYFLRFSMFKRNDRSPVVSDSDLRELGRWKALPVLLFDEDIAKGRTLTIFSETIAPLFERPRTAAVIRHGLAAFRPDFIGHQWFD